MVDLMQDSVTQSATAAVNFVSDPVVVILVIYGTLALLILVGIALPAVWSAKPVRRQAAARVLEQVLRTLRRK